MGGALLTDLYELTMASSYRRRGMDGRATFSLFVRRLPPSRGFLVAAGLEGCLAYLEALSFEPEDLDQLHELGFAGADVDALADMRFTGDVRAMPEGTVLLAGEPILEVDAPLAEGQIVETFLLNQLTFQTAVATKATRCRLAGGGRDLVDFAFRRTHGIDAAMAVARASAIAGFVATSNVEAARRYGLRASGTMAHAYVEAFGDDHAAFRAFAEDTSGAITFLVDTYDTLGGVRAAVDVVRELRLEGPIAVRLDSGDLPALTRAARAILDEAGLHRARIIATGGLDEYDIDDLVRSGAPVDGFGVGTRMGVSADAPYLDTAYKLVCYAGRPVIKLSEGKVSVPGAKQVFRGREAGDDLLALQDEQPPDGFEPLLHPVMTGGRRTGVAPSLAECRAHLEAGLAALPDEALDLRRPVSPAVRTSDRLARLTEECIARHRRPAG